LGGVAWLVRRIDSLEEKLDDHMLKNAEDHLSAALERASMHSDVRDSLHDIEARIHILERFQCRADCGG
jgi:hypothetical protein